MIDSSFKNSESAIWFHLSTKSVFYKIPRRTSNVRLLVIFFVLLVQYLFNKKYLTTAAARLFFLRKKDLADTQGKRKKDPVHPGTQRQASARSSSRRDVRGRLLLDLLWLKVAVMALPAGWRRSLCT